MDKYVCTLCGYVYDPAQGDPDNGVAAGTKWEDVPEDWECPVCGAAKEDLSKKRNAGPADGSKWPQSVTRAGACVPARHTINHTRNNSRIT